MLPARRSGDPANTSSEGKCRVCINNRGWLTRHNWHQLGDPIKQLIDEHAEPDAEREGRLTSDGPVANRVEQEQSR
ncbi:hypothetical protein [Gemmata obscuriglobus]|uniref:hypothetical protein n=1 Tax=Gemmata obscuriglobus TaxID=114 RepID=UPI001E3E1AF6|nr:hypothetical protein [Gemmata obscuriglobus]